MQSTRRFLAITLLLWAWLTPACASGNNWVDSVSLSIGRDESSIDAEVYRLGLQNHWERSWFNGGAWAVVGYWDAELAYIGSDAASAQETDDVLDLSLTPIFRLQRDTALSSGVSPYAEAGIGAHLLSDTELADQEYSSSFQFGSLIGLGLGFGKRGQYELSYRYQHISNPVVNNSSDTLNLHLLRLGYAFN